MLNPEALLLIRNQAKTEKGKLMQKVLCAYIDGYNDASAELSRFISQLHKEKHTDALTINIATKELRDKQDKRFNELCAWLNDVEAIENTVVNQEAKMCRDCGFDINPGDEQHITFISDIHSTGQFARYATKHINKKGVLNND